MMCTPAAECLVIQLNLTSLTDHGKPVVPDDRLGFFLLSLAIVSGMMFLEDMFAQRVAHKTVLSMLAWLIFGVLLWGRRQFGWRGRVAIRWSLGGFVALMLAYFGSKLVIEIILGS